MADTCGPVGSNPVGSNSSGYALPAAYIDQAIQAGASAIADMIAQTLNWIQSQLDDGASQVSKYAARIAAPIVAGLNAGTATIDQMAGAVQGQIAGQLATVPSTGTGATVGQGAYPGQYNFNVFSQRLQHGWLPPQIVNRQQALTFASAPDWCFQGSFEGFYDALNFTQNPANQLTSENCPLLKGGNGSGPQPTTQWDVGCDANGGPAIWLHGGSPPPGVTNAKGPYATFQEAQAAVVGVCSNQPQPPSPTPQPPFVCEGVGYTVYQDAVSGGCYVACDGAPQHNFNDQPLARNFGTQAEAEGWMATHSCGTPPPPQPTPTPTPTGSCASPICLPDCIKIDLCDWQAFEDHLAKGIYRGLCMWIQDPACQCPTHDSDRWAVEDCDGQYGEILKSWFGDNGKLILQGGVDAAMAAATEAVT